MKSIPHLASLTLSCLLLAASCTPQQVPSAPPATNAVTPSSTAAVPATQDSPHTFFDDFSYASQEEMTSHGWVVRAQAGWPGIPGATFRPENVTFVRDDAQPGNSLLRMTSSTDGSTANTFQTQICHQRKYLEGTYAARVYFHNEPATGPDDDQVVETFYAITPYGEPNDPAYSEMDFEYLPNGGWGLPPMTFAFTTWETVQIEPWQADNASDQRFENTQGWHTLVLQAVDGTVHYLVDGKQVAQHSGDYYPDSPMSINFNLWFINGGLTDSATARSYREEIDWVFHEAGAALTPGEVEQKVQLLRQAGTGFIDTVPAASPALESPCDL